MLISRCYSGLIDIAERYGGDVLKFRGDALLLLFDGERHEERAALAALAMQASSRSRRAGESSVGPVRLAMASGLVSGPCHFFLARAAPARADRLRAGRRPRRSGWRMRPRRARCSSPRGRRRRSTGSSPETRRRVSAAPRRRATASCPERPDGAARSCDLATALPPSLREPIEASAVEAEHRQATAAFVKFGGTDSAGRIARGRQRRRSSELADVVSAETFEPVDHLARVGHRPRRRQDVPRRGRTRRARGDDEQRMLRAVRAIVDAQASGRRSRSASTAAGCSPGRSARRAPHVRRHGRHGQSRRAADRARREGRDPRDGRRPAARSRHAFETSARQFLMKGKAKPVTGHVGRRVRSADAVEQALPPLPLVGRETELAALRDALDAARMRQCARSSSSGNAGAGKSRLLEELVANALGFQMLRTRCEPYSASTPFAPLRACSRPLVGILPEDTPEAAGEKLTTFAQAAMPDLAQWLPLLALPFDAEVPATPEVDEIDPVVPARPAARRPRPVPDADADDADRDPRRGHALARRRVAARPREARTAGPKPWLVVVTRRPSGPPLTRRGGDS